MCELDNIFDDNNEEKTVLIIDGHNIAYRCLYATIFHNPDDGENFYLWRHAVLNNIFSVVTKYNPNTLVLAFDEKGSWRYDFYKQYKAHRKGAREKNKNQIDWNRFFTVFEEFISDIKETFKNIYVIKLPRTEGDDIIGVCVNEIFKTDNIIIVSNDGDMHQLLAHPNVKQHDPKTLNIIECLNPETELELKILQGDDSDNIKGVRYGVGPVTAAKIFNVGIDEYVRTLKIKVNRRMKSSEWMTHEDKFIYCQSIDDEGKIVKDDRIPLTQDEIDYFITKEKQMIHDNYIRNTTLINLNFIPDEIKIEIKNMIENYNIEKLNPKDIIGFFKRNKMLKHLTDWNNVSEYFKALS